ncbi:MAG: DUF983 domain-containing protein [Sphingomonas sp.]|nr:DUF983 domain-containing protein [Sphingomonas sp.]MBW0007774.1 DUF983 domain-containing protein [Sphingomonas sp.]
MTRLSPLSAAITGKCPKCGERTLFDGWVSFASKCRACGLDFSSFNVGDGPAAFLIFIVGTITVVGALVVDGAFSPPWWVHLVWIPVATALTIGGLRLSKAWLIWQEYRHRARESRIAP